MSILKLSLSLSGALLVVAFAGACSQTSSDSEAASFGGGHGNHGGDASPEIQDACAHFQDAERCARFAHDAKTVIECFITFGDGQWGMGCATRASDPKVVEACTGALGYAELAMKCSIRANATPPDSIQACGNLFGNGNDGYQCALSGAQPEVVGACNGAFHWQPDLALRCLVMVHGDYQKVYDCGSRFGTTEAERQAAFACLEH